MKECVWPDECQSACKGCVRMEELLSEREAGFIEGLGAGARLRGDLLLPVRTDGIIADNMTVAYNISTGRWTAGWLATQLAVIDPDSPLRMSQEGKFLIALRPGVASSAWQ